MAFRFRRFVNCVAISSSVSLCFSISHTESPSSSSSSTTSTSLIQYRPGKNYTRIDSLLEKAHPEWRLNNAFHGTLCGENMIEEYEVYSNNDEEEIICLVRYGRSQGCSKMDVNPIFTLL